MSFDNQMSKEKVDCACLCRRRQIIESKESCSNQLKNWESWMKRRKRVHARLHQLGRQPGNLLMNIGEEYRSVYEDKLALDATKIDSDFDKYRGNPTFWKLPCSLTGKEPPFEGTEYFAVKSKEERNEIPLIERIGVPNVILSEKGILPRQRNLKNVWMNKNQYRNKILNRERSKLSKILPYNPDFSSLFIKGNKILSADDIKVAQDPKTVSKDEENATISSSLFDTSSESRIEPRISFKVNKREFYDGMSIPAHGYKFIVMFEHRTECQVPSERTIMFENSGQVVLRIYWKLFPKLKLFRDFSTTHDVFHPFKFPKSEILLLPGETLDFPIWFRSRKPGNFFECWEIYTLPPLWSEDSKVLIYLKGFAFIGDYDEKALNINNELNRRVRESLAKDVLNQVLIKGNYNMETESKSFDYTEKEIFDSKNIEESRCYGSKPKYLYKKLVVAALKDFFADVRQTGDSEKWNLSIKTLKQMARKKDLLVWFENNFAAYMRYKTSRLQSERETNAETAKKNEKPSSAKSSTKGRKESTSSTIDSNVYKKTYYEKLQDLIGTLEKPSTVKNTDRRKYFFAYVVLRMHLIKTFNALEEFDNGVTRLKDDQVPKTKQLLLLVRDSIQDRMLFEKVEEQYILRRKRVTQDLITDGKVRPKSIVTEGLDMSDAKKVFKLYFAKDDIKEKTTKKKTESDEKSSKKTTTSSKKDKSKTNTQVDDYNTNITQNFDPFAEADDVNADEPLKIPFEIVCCDVIDDEDAYREKYLLVYINLCVAIDDIVIAIEAAKQNLISPVLLADFKQTDYQKGEAADLNLSVGSCVSTSQERKESKESRTLSEKKSLTDLLYFDWLIDTHWKNNENTNKYFINEENLNKHHLEENLDVEPDPVKAVSLENAFSLETFRRKSESYCLKDKEIQVNLSEIILREHSLIASKSSSDNVSDKLNASLSKNIFYFLNEDSCDDEIISEENTEYSSISISKL